jgi:hypothetical protein
MNKQRRLDEADLVSITGGTGIVMQEPRPRAKDPLGSHEGGRGGTGRADSDEASSTGGTNQFQQ